MTYVNPVSRILRAPWENLKYRLLDEHSFVGNCVIGKQNHPSLKKLNCKTWVASSGSVLPENNSCKKTRDYQGLSLDDLLYKNSRHKVVLFWFTNTCKD